MNYNNDVGLVGDYIQRGSQFKNFKVIFPVLLKIGFTQEVIGEFTIPSDFDSIRNFTDTEKFIKFTHWLAYEPANSGGLFAYRIYRKDQQLWTNEYAYYTSGNTQEFVTPIEGYSGTTTGWNLEAGQTYQVVLLIAYPNWILTEGAVEIEFNYNTKN